MTKLTTYLDNIVIINTQCSEALKYYVVSDIEQQSSYWAFIWILDCVEKDSPRAGWADSDVDALELAEPEFVQYVGPWHVGDESPESITIDVHPELTGEEDDIYIWLTEVPQTGEDGVVGEHYGIRKYCTLE